MTTHKRRPTLAEQKAELGAALGELGRSLRDTSAYRAAERFVDWLDDRLIRLHEWRRR